MIYDGVIAVIILGMMILGHARGFFAAVLHSCSWLGAVAAGIFATGKVSAFLGDLFLTKMIKGSLDERFLESAEALDNSVNSLPELIRGGMVVDTAGTVAMFTAFLTKIIVMVITFLAIVLFVKLVLRVIVTPVVSKHRKGVIGGINRILGLFLGFVEGVVLVYLFLAILMVLVNLGSPELGKTIISNLDSSYVAGPLYDNNLLIFAAKMLQG